MNILVSNWLCRCILLMLLYSTSYAVTPNIGIVKLFYAPNAKISKFSQQDTVTKDTLLAGLESQLVAKVESSYSYDAFDAESILVSWQQVNPNILSILESTSVYVQTESMVIESQTNITPSNNYILIGWITELTYHDSINEFADINKKSIIYSIDLRARYKLFNIDTKKPIFEFTATGHGGNAMIVPSSYTMGSYRTQQAVDNTLSTFVDSVLHGLLLRHDQGYLNSDDN